MKMHYAQHMFELVWFIAPSFTYTRSCLYSQQRLRIAYTTTEAFVIVVNQRLQKLLIIMESI